MKRYGQQCSIARALDVVGERWSLLVVRELTLGPRRHRDLAAGLPGIPSNLLAARLKELQAAGVIVRRTLPPPASVPVYELTESGRALGGVLGELRTWGLAHGPESAEGDTLQTAWVMAAAVDRVTTLPEGLSGELRVDEEFYSFAAHDGVLGVRSEPAHAPDVVFRLEPDVLYDLATGDVTAAAALRQATVDGDAAVARHVVKSLAGMLSPSP
ncbi:winged helix-turn-helix transcriptional regulator [Umezawaea sp. NPDC059074]|uniref:winged helix-turn-helix transcriptional regulator n=1 Tax=Umezawaea sp. NPDC059074 TaxID=3346716 RepID=UPI0036763F01